MASSTLAGRVGLNERVFRLSQPRGQVTITSSKLSISFDAVVTVTEGSWSCVALEVIDVTLVDSLSWDLANPTLAISPRTDL